MKKNPSDKTPNAKTTAKRKSQSRKQLAPGQHKRSRMEVATYTLGICAIVAFGVAALLGVVHMRDASIWTTWLACVLTLTGGFCWLQDREWEKDAANAKGVTETARPRIWLKAAQPKFENFSTPYGTPIVELLFENKGDAAAFDTRVEVWTFIASKELSDVPQPFPPLVNEPGSMFVPVGETMSQSIGSPRDPLPGGSDLRTFLENQTAYFYFFGFAKYEGRPNKKRYITKFCAVYSGPRKTFQATPFHNDMD